MQEKKIVKRAHNIIRSLVLPNRAHNLLTHSLLLSKLCAQYNNLLIINDDFIQLNPGHDLVISCAQFSKTRKQIRAHN